MWRVRTGGRLHLGLLSLPGSSERWPDRHGEPTFAPRRFGGVGLMIDTPCLSLRVEEAAHWSAEGPLADRATEYARRVQGHAQGAPRRVVVEQAPREHVGLGAGTQLGLAVAAGLAASWGLAPSIPMLARWVGRGLRSALGVHGFAHGGFLVEAGKSSDDGLSPLVARLPVPEEWRILFVEPPSEIGRHGPEERAAFEQLSASLATSEALTRLALLGMLPALAEGNLDAFGEAVFDYNARAGEVFAAEQGGVYAGPAVSELIAWFRREGVRGVGQSSWGPGVFAFVADEARARDLAGRLRVWMAGAPGEVHLARVLNRGAVVEAA